MTADGDLSDSDHGATVETHWPLVKGRVRYSRWLLVIVSSIIVILGLNTFAHKSTLATTFREMNSALSSKCPEEAARTQTTEVFRAANLAKPSEMMDILQITLMEPSSAMAGYDLEGIPKFIHQSWMDDNLPNKFSNWRRSWRVMNPDWSYVLWTDHDNRELIRRFFPWFLEVYDSLPKSIMRADISRNFYMFAFGGMYADLDSECLRPMKYLFDGLEKKGQERLPGTHIAYIGRMGEDTSFPQDLPNAWFASQSGHPFFMLPVIELMARHKVEDYKSWTAEDASGPKALKRSVNLYRQNFTSDPNALAQFISDELPGVTHIMNHFSVQKHALQLLDPDVIYPVNWHVQSPLTRICKANDEAFDPELCKQQIIGSYMVTYWSHSWSEGAGSHDVEHMDKLNAPES